MEIIWKNLGVYWLAFSIFSLSLPSQAMCVLKDTKPKIVVIGAGAAGLASATKLLEYGFEDVILLEAEPRFGGRVHTIPFGDNVVDLGAQWCHGQKNNVVYEMVENLNLVEPSADIVPNATIARSNGDIVTRKVAQELNEIVDDITKNYQDKSLSYNGSMHDFFLKIYKRILSQPEYEQINWDVAQEYFVNFEQVQVTLTGTTTLDEVPAHGDPQYEISEGEYHLNWKDKGYKEFLRILIKSAEVDKADGILEGRIAYSSKVKEINWQRDDSKVLITTEGGEQILADHVIVTVSLGVLKATHHQLFEPSLPDNKKLTIEGIGFGTINKILIEFPTQFWPAYWTGFLMLWREEDLKEIRGTKMDWLTDIIGFHTIDYQSRTLEGWAVGEKGPKVEILSNDEAKAACMYLFKRFLPWDIPEAINVLTTKWSTNTNFYGSYSSPTIKQEEMGVSRDDLANPLYATLKNCEEAKASQQCQLPLVLFAGEATNSKHHSTVHGAVETGWREAKRLANFYSIE